MLTTLTIKGTHCASCKALIEEASLEVPGITGCTVDYATGKTELEHNGDLDIPALQKAISEVGDYAIVQSLRI